MGWRDRDWRPGSWRGVIPLIFAWPLLLLVPVSMLFGQGRGLTGALLGLGLFTLAAMRVRRGQRGDARRSAVLVGVGAGLVAGLGAGVFPPIAVAFGFGAWAGARLLWDNVAEAAPPPPPVPEPAPAAFALPLEQAAARLAAMRAAAPRLPLAAQLATTVTAMEGLREELAPRPDALPDARRFLLTNLDGLERIRERLAAGAEPPATLAPLLSDMARAADDWRGRLRMLESQALDIQVKVMSDRLREREP